MALVAWWWLFFLSFLPSFLPVNSFLNDRVKIPPSQHWQPQTTTEIHSPTLQISLTTDHLIDFSQKSPKSLARSPPHNTILITNARYQRLLPWKHHNYPSNHLAHIPQVSENTFTLKFKSSLQSLWNPVSESLSMQTTKTFPFLSPLIPSEHFWIGCNSDTSLLYHLSSHCCQMGNCFFPPQPHLLFKQGKPLTLLYYSPNSIR